MEYVIQFTGKHKIALVDRVFTLSTSGITTLPDNIAAEGRLKTPLLSRRDMFDKLTTYGAISAGGGEIAAVNDGGLDELVTDYATNGREVSMWVAPKKSKNFPADYSLIYRGTIKLITSTFDTLKIQISDKMQSLEKPLLQTKYLGNNVLPNGLEGVAGDIKGERKPRVYGAPKNFSPYLVNTASLIYQVSDKPCTVSAAYSRGVPWTFSGNYATIADLQNVALNPPSAGYKVYSGVDGCYIKVGSVPAGTVTVDAATTETRCAELIKTIALDAGIALADIYLDDVAALNVITYQCGAWVSGETTALQAMSFIASGIGAYFSFDRLGKLRMSRLEAPSGLPVFEIFPDIVSKIELVSTADTDQGVPAKTLTLEYAKNYTVQTDLDNTAAASRAAFAAAEWRHAVATSASAAALYVDAPEITVETSLVNEADALAESTRRIEQLQSRRVFEVTASADDGSPYSTVDIGDVIRVTYPRFGLDNGEIFRVIGIVYDTRLSEITLRIWG